MSAIRHDRRSARMRRHKRVREKIFGTAERPRLSVFRSLNHIYAQVIDDEAGRTIVSASSLKAVLPSSDEEVRGGPESVKVRRSRAVGKAIAEAALAKGITQVSFDRGGYLFHGRIAALAEAARKAGLKF